MALTGDKVVATATVSDTQTTVGTTTSTSFTATLTGGTTCGVAFVAPPSGQVIVFNTAGMANSEATYTFTGFEVRTGGVVGSGTVFLAADDTRSLRVAEDNFIRYTVAHLVTGLTAGSTYNVRQMFRTNAGTLNVSEKHLIVQPQP
ncbi:MAG TPA: hypothetical protein VGX25_35405 [Actinophytocola sp.]|uniref:hypothetical protein n=1 Tax=Actinophytocola sp. TaxID=1872138 RepID=UPI002DDD0F0A|nr:hypothetical protein [Actinophytocola sp.]HEV2784702.1 hypothetical protein [Actinophytocola sp.]